MNIRQRLFEVSEPNSQPSKNIGLCSSPDRIHWSDDWNQHEEEGRESSLCHL